MEVSRPTADVLVHRARGAFKVAFVKLAGDGAAAPASLGLVLAPLSVPAALHLMPPVPHVAPPAASHLAPSAHGPSSAGLLTKLATLGASKIAIGAAVVGLLAAGGAVEVARHAEHHPSAAHAATRPAQLSSPLVKARFVSQPRGYWHTRWGCGEWSDQQEWHEMHDFCDDRSHGETGSDDGSRMSDDSSETAGHDTMTHASGDSDTREGTAHSEPSNSGTTPHDDTSSGGSTDSGTLAHHSSSDLTRARAAVWTVATPRVALTSEVKGRSSPGRPHV